MNTHAVPASTAIHAMVAVVIAILRGPRARRDEHALVPRLNDCQRAASA